jgi:hypothetical protein
MTPTHFSMHSWLACAGWLTLLACSSSTPASSPAPAPPYSSTPTQAAAPAAAASPSVDSNGWLVVDSAGRSVTLDLKVTPAEGAPSARINGYRSGEARIVVPLGWTVKWNWRSSDSTTPHSLVVMVQREKIPLEGGRASLANAMTRMVTEGLPAGQTDQTTFSADEAGWYWMLCGVPSHALNGEWLELRVDPAPTTASLQVKKKS